MMPGAMIAAAEGSDAMAYFVEGSADICAGWRKGADVDACATEVASAGCRLVMLAAGGDDDVAAGAIAGLVPLLRSAVMMRPLLQSSSCAGPLSSLCTSELVGLLSSTLLVPSAEGGSTRAAKDASLLDSDCSKTLSGLERCCRSPRWTLLLVRAGPSVGIAWSNVPPHQTVRGEADSKRSRRRNPCCCY